MNINALFASSVLDASVLDPSVLDASVLAIVRTVFREREIETLDKKLPLYVRCRCRVEHPRGSTMDILQALLAKMGHLANRNASFC